MIINLTNKRYGITGTYDIDNISWSKHQLMHPKRSEEALQSNLSVCYGVNTPVTNKMIEKVIEDEYIVYRNLPDIVMKAREEYKQLRRREDKLTVINRTTL